MQEAGETDKEWEPVAMDLTTPDYTVRNISPRKDYRFRIRAKTENGDISEPTPPITFYRTQGKSCSVPKVIERVSEHKLNSQVSD